MSLHIFYDILHGVPDHSAHLIIGHSPPFVPVLPQGMNGDAGDRGDLFFVDVGRFHYAALEKLSFNILVMAIWPLPVIRMTKYTRADPLE